MNTSWGNLTQRWGVDLKMALNGKHHKQQGPFICGIRTKQFFFRAISVFVWTGKRIGPFLIVVVWMMGKTIWTEHIKDNAVVWTGLKLTNHFDFENGFSEVCRVKSCETEIISELLKYLLDRSKTYYISSNT